MKKITRIAALLAAGALLFGAVGCSSGGGSDEEGTGGGGSGGGGSGSGGGGGGGGSEGDDTSATIKYLQLTNTSNSSNVTPDWSATVSDTSVVTATNLVWTLVDGLTHKQWDIKVGNNSVAEAMLEEQTEGTGTENGLASVSFDITAVKALKLKTISAITSSGKTPTGITCWINGEAVAQGVQYSDAASKAFKLSDASLDDYEVAAGDTVTIKITSDKTSKATADTKIDFGQISLTVEAAGTTGGIQGGGQQGGGDNSGNTGSENESQGGGDNSGDSGNTGNGNENQGGNNESGDQGGEDGGEEGESPAVTGALTGTWTALDYVPDGEINDKTAITNGTALGNVTVYGTTVVWRTSSNKWTHFELGKNSEGCLTFTIGAESKVTVKAASTGGSNTSDIVLCTGNDGTGAVTGSANTVTGTSYTSVTYETVPAGTYYLGAFPAVKGGNERGVRIESITVEAK